MGIWEGHFKALLIIRNIISMRYQWYVYHVPSHRDKGLLPQMEKKKKEKSKKNLVLLSMLIQLVCQIV